MINKKINYTLIITIITVILAIAAIFLIITKNKNNKQNINNNSIAIQSQINLKPVLTSDDPTIIIPNIDF